MSSSMRKLSVPLGRSLLLFGSGCRAGNFRPSPQLLRHFSQQTGGQQAKGRFMESSTGLYVALAAVGVGGGYYIWSQSSPSCPKKTDYQQVYNEIAKMLDDVNYDDGSYGPVFLRLAWHASGTYDKATGTGGSHRGTMRFSPEANFDANAGLEVARTRLEKVKAKFPFISYGDLWTLAGVVAVQEMGGPTVAWKPGRVDGTAADCPPDGRLPDGGNPSPQHPRDIFYRMGFNDQEIVALAGAHSLGRCHPNRSGFDGPWTFSPTAFSNSYYKEMMERRWVEKKWSGPKQFVDKETGEIMMLPADLAFLNDPSFRKWVEIYAKDEKRFFQDFAKAFQKLLELGVPFKDTTKEYTFKPTP